MKIIRIPYSSGGVFIVSLPSRNLLGVWLPPKAKRPLVPRDLARAIDRPLEGAPIPEVFRKAQRVVIVVPDGTRHAHLAGLLAPILDRLKRAGVPSSKTKILIATGLHRAHTAPELETILGRGVSGRAAIVQHSPRAGSFETLGRSASGVPITIDKHLLEADAILCLGVIEPHLYAGYSGGAKTIAIGCAGEPTINATHAPKFLDHPKVRLGLVDGNPFQRVLWESLDKLPVRFIVNVLNDGEGRLAGIFAGSPRAVFGAGIRKADQLYRIKVKEPADAVLCGVGSHKDVNFYQTSRAFNYVLSTERPIVKKGGFVIACAGLKEGIGSGLGEQRFYRELKTVRSPEAYVKKIKRQGCQAGEHRAYMVAQAMTQANLVVVGETAPEVLRGLPILAFKNLEETLAHVRRSRGPRATFHSLPLCLSTIATL